MTKKLAIIVRTDVWRSVHSLTHKEATTMRLKSALTRGGLVLPLVLLGLLAAAPMVSAAEWTDHSGTVCKNYNAGEVSYVDYFTNGTRIVTKTTPTAVICPLSRNTTGTNGAYIYVHITHSGTQTTACTAYSYSLNGTPLAAGSGSATGSGRLLLGLNLYGAGKSAALSNYSVYCTIPGSGNGVLNTVDVYEY